MKMRKLNCHRLELVKANPLIKEENLVSTNPLNYQTFDELNYLAIEKLEALDIQAPSQEQIDLMEEILRVSLVNGEIEPKFHDSILQFPRQ